MNFKLVFAALAVFVMAFASAQQMVVDEAQMVIEPTSTATGQQIIVDEAQMVIEPTSTATVPPAPYIDISIISPSEGKTLITSSNNLDVDFTFTANGVNFIDKDYPISCRVMLTGSSISDVELDALLDEAVNVWNVPYNLPIGSYEWYVSCNANNNNYGMTWETTVNRFSIESENNGGSSSGGSSSSSGGGSRRVIVPVEEEGNRKPLAENELPLTNLSNTNTQNTNNNAKGFSGITGAVVGVLGEKGALWFGVFLVIVGVAGLFIYNRARFGLVKAK